MSYVQKGSDGAVIEASPAAEKPNTYGQILRSTTLVGGAQVANLAIGLVRTKALAVLLGPSGFGLLGLYSSISDLTQAVAGLGLNSSGVRQISEAAAAEDANRLAATAAALRKASVAAGLLGALLLAALSLPISRLTFGSEDHWVQICLLGGMVFLQLVAFGRGALIQGMRRIGDLARMSVTGALLGAVASITLVYFLRSDGIVLSLIAVAGSAFVSSWWFSRKISLPRPEPGAAQFRREASGLLGLGVAFMASSLMTMGSAYVIRLIITGQAGIEATGLYQAAWTLGGLYVGIVLQAMGADFYPRLTAAIHDNELCNRLTNEQAQVNFLLAGPGVLGTLVFAPIVMKVLYAPEFAPAVDTLRWLCIGVAMRIIGWPLGYILIAKGMKGRFFLSDFIWTFAHVGMAFLLVPRFGVEGAGIAFFAAYVVHTGINYFLARSVTKFRWSSAAWRAGTVCTATTAAGFIICTQLLPATGFVLGFAVLAITLAWTLLQLQTIVRSSEVSAGVAGKLLKVLSILRAGPGR